MVHNIILVKHVIDIILPIHMKGKVENAKIDLFMEIPYMTHDFTLMY